MILDNFEKLYIQKSYEENVDLNSQYSTYQMKLCLLCFNCRQFDLLKQTFYSSFTTKLLHLISVNNEKNVKIVILTVKNSVSGFKFAEGG